MFTTEVNLRSRTYLTMSRTATDSLHSIGSAWCLSLLLGLGENMKTVSNTHTEVHGPHTFLQQLLDDCLANVSAEHMGEARRVVEEYNVKVAPISGKRFHYDEQCPAIRQAVRVQDWPLKRACTTFTAAPNARATSNTSFVRT